MLTVLSVVYSIEIYSHVGWTFFYGGDALVIFNSVCQIHTTHTFNSPLFGTTRVRWYMSRYQKGKTSLDFTETVSGSGISWAICKSAPHSRQITMSALHRSVFLQAGFPSCDLTYSIKALKAHCQIHITYAIIIWTLIFWTYFLTNRVVTALRHGVLVSGCLFNWLDKCAYSVIYMPYEHDLTARTTATTTSV